MNYTPPATRDYHSIAYMIGVDIVSMNDQPPISIRDHLNDHYPMWPEIVEAIGFIDAMLAVERGISDVSEEVDA